MLQQTANPTASGSVTGFWNGDKTAYRFPADKSKPGAYFEIKKAGKKENVVGIFLTHVDEGNPLFRLWKDSGGNPPWIKHRLVSQAQFQSDFKNRRRRGMQRRIWQYLKQALNGAHEGRTEGGARARRDSTNLSYRPTLFQVGPPATGS